ncbi:uncharacterized protein LOC109272265 [Panthera pardus]|uniref:Uncharacterized protein LOC109272265 n=1 Tax=Panthera pardus TaxID=9691 RepID=A0A9W2UHR8_PANPR|nr:uncharacterized protein LOC109272265 [Panthera pardus]
MDIHGLCRISSRDPCLGQGGWTRKPVTCALGDSVPTAVRMSRPLCVLMGVAAGSEFGCVFRTAGRTAAQRYIQKTTWTYTGTLQKPQPDEPGRCQEARNQQHGRLTSGQCTSCAESNRHVHSIRSQQQHLNSRGTERESYLTGYTKQHVQNQKGAGPVQEQNSQRQNSPASCRPRSCESGPTEERKTYTLASAAENVRITPGIDSNVTLLQAFLRAKFDPFPSYK